MATISCTETMLSSDSQKFSQSEDVVVSPVVEKVERKKYSRSELLALKEKEAQSAFVKSLKHQELLEALEVGRVSAEEYKKEMNRRRKLRDSRRQLRKMAEKKVEVPTAFDVVVSDTAVATGSFVQEKSELSQVVLKKPLIKADVEKMLIHKTYGPWWTKKINAYIEMMDSNVFEERVNAFAYSRYASGTVEYWEDLMFGSRRRRDKFVAMMDEPVPDDDEIAVCQSYEPSSDEPPSERLGFDDLPEVNDEDSDDDNAGFYSDSEEEDPIPYDLHVEVWCHAQQVNVDFLMLVPDWMTYLNMYCIDTDCPGCEKSHSCARCDGHGFVVDYEESEFGVYDLRRVDSDSDDDEDMAVVQADEPVLEEVASLAGRANVTFMEERETDQDSTHISTEVSAADPNMDMAERPWSAIRQVLEREVMVYRGEWVEDQKREFLSLGIPKILTDKNTFIRRQLEVFAFLRAGIEFRIQFNGNRFDAGSLVFAILPPMFDEDVSNYNLFQSYNFPHIRIDAAVSNVGVLFVPFTHLLSHFPQQKNSLESDSMVTLGRIVGYTINPLKVVAGSVNSLSYTIYARLVNPELHQTTWPISEFSYSDGIITQAGGEGEGLFKKIVGGGLSTALGAFLSKMTGGLATGLGSILTGLIFDYPHDPMPAEHFVNESVSPLCYGAGVDHSIRLALTPVSQTETYPAQIGSTDGDFNLKTLLQIPSLLQIVQLSNQSLPGALLWSAPVCPTYLSTQRISTDSNSAIYYPTMQAYICRAFCGWRGGLIYKFQLIKTEFNNARLMIVYSPHINPKTAPDNVTTSNLETFNQSNTIIVDIEEQKEFSILVPYMAPVNWLSCQSFRTGNSYIDAPKDVQTNMTFLGESNCGYLSMYVQSKFTNPPTVVGDFEMNVCISVADDFDLTIPNTLFPLNVTSFGTASFGAYEQYPWVLGDKVPIPDQVGFENREWILACYYDGKKLYDVGYIEKRTATYWYQYLPVQYIGTTNSEVINWCYRASVIAKYLEEESGVTNVQARFIQLLPGYEPAAETQALEEYTTGRKSEPMQICPTVGNRTAEIAPQTVSENAMNLQTILRRFYCIYNSTPIYNYTGYTMVTIPVNPSVTPVFRHPITTNKGSFLGDACPTNHIAWFSKLYTYWRGSLRYKIVFEQNDFDAIVLYIPTETSKFSVASGVSEGDMQKLMTFASAIAVSRLQGALEVSVPYQSFYEQLFIDVHNKYYDRRCQNGTLYLFFRNKGPMEALKYCPLTFQIFMATDEDFRLNVLKAPPKVEEPLITFGRCEGEIGGITIAYPEAVRNTGYNQRRITTPYETGIKKVTELGYPAYCYADPPEEDAVIQMLSLPKNAGKLVNDMQEIIDSGSIQRSVGHLENVASKLDDALKDDQLKDTLQSLNCISRKVEGVLGKAASIANAPIENATIGKYALMASEVVLCGTFVHHVRESLINPCLTNFITMGIELGLIVGLTVSESLQGVIMRVVNWAMDFRMPGQAQAQVLDEVTDFIEDHTNVLCSVVAVIGTVFYAYLFDALPSFDRIKAAIKNFFEDDEGEVQGLEKSLGFSLKNAHFSLLGLSALEKVYNKLIEWAQKLIFWFLEQENPEALLARTSCEIQERVLALIAEIDYLDYEPHFLVALESPVVHNRFYAMQNEVFELTRLCTTSKVDQKVVHLLSECRKRSQHLLKKMEKEQCCASTRYDPFTICIHGDPGTGKTKIADKFVQMAREVMNLSPYNLLYPKNIRDDFWSGYTNQPIVLWDEFGQSKKADETAIPEFMTLRGDKPVKVNMASLDDKGRNFTSQCIILTTNSPYAHIDTIRSTLALNRRRHIMLGMQFRRGYDENMLSRARFDDFPNWEHCAFSITNNMTPDILQAGMSMEQVLNYVRTEMTRHHQNEMDRIAASEHAFLPRGIVAIPNPQPEALQRIEEDANIEDQVEREVHNRAIEEVEDMMRNGVQFRNLNPYFNLPDDEGDDEDEYLEAHELVELERDQNEQEQQEGEQNLLDPPVVQMLEQFCYWEDLFTIDENLSAEERWVAELWLASAERFDARKILKTWRRAKATVKSAPSRLYKLAESLFTSLRQKVTEFWENNPKLCKVLGVLTLLTGVGAIMYFRSSKEIEAYESGPARSQKMRVLPETYESGPARPTKVKVIAHGSDDPQAVEIMDKIKKYTYPIRWVEGERKAKMNCIHIGGHLILAPYHFFNHAKDGDWFEVAHRVHPCKVEFHRDLMVREGNKDWILYDCGPRLETGSKKMVSFFIDENQLGKFKQSKCVLLVRNVKDGECEKLSGMCKPQQEFTYKDPNYGDVYKQCGWEHDLNTQAGHCGGPLIAINPAISSPGKILGIHSAGYVGKSRGFCVLITRQQVERLMLLAQPQCSEAPVPECIRKGYFPTMRIVPDGDFSIVGEMPNTMAPAQPLKSSLIETPFHEEAEKVFGPSPRIPAKLKPFEHEGVRISPLKKAIVKYGHSTIPYSRRNLLKVERFLIHYFKQKLSTHTGRRIFSIEEAVQGIPGVEFAEHINKKSSPGWPYQMENKSPGKWHLFNESGSIVNVELQRRLLERRDSAMELNRVPSVWRDCLKDELRPTAKVEQGKTRLFTIAPVDFTILTRQYFFDFIMSFHAAQGNEFFSAVGINPESPDWTRLYHYLTYMNTNVVAGDYECFDGKEMPEIIMMVCNIINAWYDDCLENQNVRKTIFEEIIHTMQLCENTVYMTHQGNPSGNPLTTIINTIVNLILMLLTWLEIFPQSSVEDFFRWVRFIAYGDDNIVAIAEHLLKLFNQNTIAQALAKHNIIYTSESKTTGEVPDFRSITEITFLKRGFRVNNEFGDLFVVPTMSIETLNSYFFYYRKSPDPEEQLRENQRSALQFAAFHGRQFYNKYLSHWQEFMKISGFNSLQISFEEQVDAFHYSAGMLESRPKHVTRTENGIIPEGFERFMKVTNSKPVRFVGGVIEAPFYAIAATLGILSKPAHEPTDDRWAIAIPSGEGKSSLARQYPHLFVDHDDLLIPQFQKSKTSMPWSAKEACKHDFPQSDRRVLLVHHPTYTNRRLVGSFITPFPTFIRMNCIQRLRLKEPIKMSIPDRNLMLVQLCSMLEPSLVEGKQNRSELTAYARGDACLNQPASSCIAENIQRSFSVQPN